MIACNLFFFDRILVLPGNNVGIHPIQPPVLLDGNRNLQCNSQLHIVCGIGGDNGTETDTKGELLPLSCFYGVFAHRFSDFDSVSYVFSLTKCLQIVTYRRSSSAPVCTLGHLPPGGRLNTPTRGGGCRPFVGLLSQQSRSQRPQHRRRRAAGHRADPEG